MLVSDARLFSGERPTFAFFFKNFLIFKIFFQEV